MRKIILASALVALAALTAPASAFGPKSNGFAAGAVVGAGGLSFSGGKTFANNTQKGAGEGYAQTEGSANAAIDFQAGTNLPFRLNGAFNSGSQSQAGSSVNGANGSVSNSTGGAFGSGVVLGGGVAAGAIRK